MWNENNDQINNNIVYSSSSFGGSAPSNEYGAPSNSGSGGQSYASNGGYSY